MAVVLTNTGLDLISQYLLGKAAHPGWSVFAYVNNYAPQVTDTLGNYVECSAGGYARIPLVGANWTGSASSGIADYQYPTIAFTFNDNGGGQTVYGYGIVDGGGNVVWAELFATPYAIPSAGGALALQIFWEDHLC